MALSPLEACPARLSLPKLDEKSDGPILLHTAVGTRFDEVVSEEIRKGARNASEDYEDRHQGKHK